MLMFLQVMNDPEDKKLTDFSVNIFQNSYYNDAIISFNLCEGIPKLVEVEV